MRLVGKRVSRNGLFQLGSCSDISRVELGNRNKGLALHRGDLTKALGHALRHAVWLSFGRQNAGVNAEQRNPSGEWIGKRLEYECGERFVVGNLPLDILAVSVLACNGTV